MTQQIIQSFDKFNDFERSKLEGFMDDKDRSLEEATKVFEKTLIKLEENKHGKV